MDEPRSRSSSAPSTPSGGSTTRNDPMRRSISRRRRPYTSSHSGRSRGGLPRSPFPITSSSGSSLRTPPSAGRGRKSGSLSSSGASLLGSRKSATGPGASSLGPSTSAGPTSVPIASWMSKAGSHEVTRRSLNHQPDTFCKPSASSCIANHGYRTSSVPLGSSSCPTVYTRQCFS